MKVFESEMRRDGPANEAEGRRPALFVVQRAGAKLVRPLDFLFIFLRHHAVHALLPLVLFTFCEFV